MKNMGKFFPSELGWLRIKEMIIVSVLGEELRAAMRVTRRV